MDLFPLVRISGHTFIGGVINDSSIVLDLGANRGAFSREMLRRFGCKQILAIEPTPKLATLLKDIEGLRVRQCVVNGTGEGVNFRVDTNNSESSCIVVGGESLNCFSVQGITLSELVGDNEIVDLAKMDVEGTEIEILRGTPDEVLKRVKQFAIEFHDFKPGSGVKKADVLAVVKRMRAIGFRVFVNSFWTYGDVLFVNTALIPVGKRDAVSLAIWGRWWPGIKRVVSRVRAGCR